MAGRKGGGIQFDSPDEREVFHAKESWVPVMLGGLPFVVLGVIALVVAWRFFNNTTVGFVLLGAGILVALVTRAPRVIANLDTDVVVTDRRLYARTGLVDIKDQVCDLANIADVTVDPTLLGRIFDYADVQIQTYAGDSDFDLRGIAHAYEMRKAISHGADAANESRGRSRRGERR